MSTSIAQTAVVDPRAKIGTNVRIGHFCVIGPDVSIGDNTRIEDHVVMAGICSLGEGQSRLSGVCDWWSSAGYQLRKHSNAC